MSRDRVVEHRPPRRRVVTPEEARIWRAVVQDATPLPGHDLPSPEEPAPPVPPTAPPAYPTSPPVVAAPPSPAPLWRIPPEELKHGKAPGLDKRSGERLKRGEMHIDARLDLHGLTQDAAHGALLAFVGRAFEAGRRCVLVITGKGGREGAGVLRSMVPRWLNQSPLRERIIGFSFAQARDGGDGALYVLVKRRRG